ncbi:MAG: FAD:protein FMN transferase, partial [Bacillota bacterium]
DDYAGVNNIKVVNDNAGNAPVLVDSRIIDLLQYAKEQYVLTKGTLNIALGPVLKLWHDYREAGTEDTENAELPPMALLQEENKHTNIDDLIIDASASTVYFRDPLMRLDVGAIAKGYATEQVAQYFEQQGVTNLLLSVGGNVRALGGKFEDSSDKVVPWKVGVKNPDLSSSETELLSVPAEDCSVVSSGIYERYYTVDGVQYHHIIDPETLMPATHYAQVTIVCRDSGLADALSTAAFVLPRDEALAYINAMDGVEACWVLKDGNQFYSDGFEALQK